MVAKPGYKQTEVGVIPEEWELVTAGEIGRFRGGNGFPLKYQGLTNGAYPFFKVSDMNNDGNGTFMTAANHRISEGTRKELGATAFPADSIVFAKVGAAIFLERKKILGQPSCIDNNLTAFMLDPVRADVRFVHTLLLTTKLGSLVSTTALPSLSGKQLSDITLRLPPLPEQRAIATALSDVDALLGALDRLIAKKRDLKQAAMQQLLTGQTRLPGFHGEWEETTLGQIGECIIGLTYKPENVVEHGLLVLRSSNVQNGRLAYADNVYVNLEVPEHLVTRPGDILICVRNGSRALIGKCAIVDKAAAGVTFGAFMSVYRTKHSRFIFHAFQAYDIQRQIYENIGATINQITNRDMNSFRVKLPPESEQIAIAEVLSDMDAELAALEQRRAKSQALKHGMMQELLTGRIRLVEG